MGLSELLHDNLKPERCDAMKHFLALCCLIATTVLPAALNAGEWLTDFEAAKNESAKTKRPIFILFTNSERASGYDTKLFNTKRFRDYADQNLVLMKADFPNNTYRQSQALRKQNTTLRNTFKPPFLPWVFLLNAKGELYVDFPRDEHALSPRVYYDTFNAFLNEYDPAKKYIEHIDPYVKKYVPPVIEKKEETADAKAATEKKTAAKKPAKKADKTEDKAKDKEEPPASVDANGSPLIPIDPEGDVQEWLKSVAAGEAAEKEAEDEAVRETVEAKKEALEGKTAAEQPK